MKRSLLALVLAPFFPLIVPSAWSQDAPPPPPPAAHAMPAPKNLKILKPEEVMPTMHAIRVGLGVKCSFCHVEGDFASDEKHHKEIARHMLTMTNEINGRFNDGKVHVTCYTCHRGAEEPLTQPVAEAHEPAAH